MISAIEEGLYQPSMKARMDELERQKADLMARLAGVPADVPDILPNVSAVCRKKVERLVAALNEPKEQAEAAEAIRGLIERITLRPGPNRGEVDATLHGEQATIMRWVGAQPIGTNKKTEIHWSSPFERWYVISWQIGLSKTVRFFATAAELRTSRPKCFRREQATPPWR
ncbi:MAG TPA: hypothetical protein VFF19_22070 [Reyranella sp.]|jgi:hypothetical protein|nr:hypothetical protein [Reyranella sp.]